MPVSCPRCGASNRAGAKFCDECFAALSPPSLRPTPEAERAKRGEHNEHRYEAEIHRLKGELLLKRDCFNDAEAESCFERAIEIARKQSAKSQELRATVSLARLLAKQSRRGEARAMLAEIYNWFIKGFDTADLKDAKALRDELSAQ
jgi:predicted ATPase